MAKITLGDSTIGYDTAKTTVTKSGKHRLVADAVSGRITHIRAAIAALNRGESAYITPNPARDCKPIRVDA